VVWASGKKGLLIGFKIFGQTLSGQNTGFIGLYKIQSRSPKPLFSFSEDRPVDLYYAGIDLILALREKLVRNKEALMRVLRNLFALGLVFISSLALAEVVCWDPFYRSVRFDSERPELQLQMMGFDFIGIPSGSEFSIIGGMFDQSTYGTPSQTLSLVEGAQPSFGSEPSGGFMPIQLRFRGDLDSPAWIQIFFSPLGVNSLPIFVGPCAKSGN
jgi:hypothetical protein